MSEDLLNEAFRMFDGSKDFGSCPARAVPDEGGGSGVLLHHQAINAMSWLGLFVSPGNLSVSDYTLIREVWPLLTPEQDGMCKLPAFRDVLAPYVARRPPRCPPRPASSSPLLDFDTTSSRHRVADTARLPSRLEDMLLERRLARDPPSTNPCPRTPSPPGAATYYNAGPDGLVEVAWDGHPSRSPSPASPPSDQVLLNRIEELRAELAALRRQRREEAVGGSPSVEAWGVYGRLSSTSSSSSRADEAARTQPLDNPYDDRLRQRWGERDARLVRELEHLHGEVARERAAPQDHPHPTGRGWETHASQLVPLVLTLDLHPARYSQLRRVRGGRQRFMAAAAAEVAAAFRTEPDLLRVTACDTGAHRVQMEFAFASSEADVRSKQVHLQEELRHLPVQSLKQASKEFYRACGTRAPCRLVEHRCWVGTPRPHGTSPPPQSCDVRLLVDHPFNTFDPQYFMRSLSRHVEPQGVSVDLVGVRERRGLPMVRVKVSGRESSRSARRMAADARNPRSRMHEACGRVRDAEVVESEGARDISTASSATTTTVGTSSFSESSVSSATSRSTSRSRSRSRSKPGHSRRSKSPKSPQEKNVSKGSRRGSKSKSKSKSPTRSSRSPRSPRSQRSPRSPRSQRSPRSPRSPLAAETAYHKSGGPPPPLSSPPSSPPFHGSLKSPRSPSSFGYCKSMDAPTLHSSSPTPYPSSSRPATGVVKHMNPRPSSKVTPAMKLPCK